MDGAQVKILVGRLSAAEVSQVQAFGVAAEDGIVHVVVSRVGPAAEAAGVDMGSEAEEGLAGRPVPHAVDVDERVGRRCAHRVVPYLVQQALEPQLARVRAQGCLGRRAVKLQHGGRLGRPAADAVGVVVDRTLGKPLDDGALQRVVSNSMQCTRHPNSPPSTTSAA